MTGLRYSGNKLAASLEAVPEETSRPDLPFTVSDLGRPCRTTSAASLTLFYLDSPLFHSNS